MRRRQLKRELGDEVVGARRQGVGAVRRWVGAGRQGWELGDEVMGDGGKGRRREELKFDLENDVPGNTFSILRILKMRTITCFGALIPFKTIC